MASRVWRGRRRSRRVPPGATLFVGPQGLPVTRATLSELWRAAVKTVGAPAGLRIHDLRHHAATLVGRMPGITTNELMARIGHASLRAALIYQHATAERTARWPTSATARSPKAYACGPVRSVRAVGLVWA